MSNKKNVAVLGAGVMGTGIAQLFASKGYPVTIIYGYCQSEASRDNAGKFKNPLRQ